MEHSYIEDHQVIDRYLMKDLPAEEAALFEDHYVYCQQCLDQLELAEKLQKGFKRAVAGEAATVAMDRQGGVGAWLGRMARSPLVTAGLAALLFLAILPMSWIVRDLRDARVQLDEAAAARWELASQLDRAREPQANTIFMAIRPERSTFGGGEDPTHVVRLSEDPEWIVLSFDLDGVAEETFRVVLFRGEQEVWRHGGLSPDHRGFLTLSLHSTWLEPGNYVARVGKADTSKVSGLIPSFAFRVTVDD